MTSRAYRAAVTCAAIAVAAGFLGQAQAQNFTPVTDAVLQNPDPADWLSWRRTTVSSAGSNASGEPPCDVKGPCHP